MASPFQRYQSGIEASTGNLVPAYGQMAGQTANAIAGFGQNLAQGLQQYNENSAKNDVLTAEAEQLGQQIQQFAAQFGDSPEHKPFADSLQPYIQQLSKVPSQSLTQKMGTVTGVKAAFGNIGQQLQVFEMMRKERMARDMNSARGGVREFDEQTVPTAIIPSGKLPYFYGKNYTEQEGELVRLTNEAKAKGANVDLPKVLSDWRKGLKANAMSRPDLPPQIKEALVKQIDAGEGLTENIQTDESGVTDYAKEAEMYDKASTSVKEQLAPPKVEAPVEKDLGNKEQYKTNIAVAINALKAQKETASPELKDNIDSFIKSYEKEIKTIQKEENKIKEVETAKSEISNIDKQIQKLEESVSNGESLQGDSIDRAKENLLSATGKYDTWIKSMFVPNAAKYQNTKFTQETADQFVKESMAGLNGNASLGIATARRVFDISPLGVLSKYIWGNEGGRKLSTEEARFLENSIQRYSDQDNVSRSIEYGTDSEKIQALKQLKKEYELTVSTGVRNPSNQVRAEQQQAQTQEAKPEPEYVLTNQYNMTLGTTTGQVATSLESKRNDMKTFFQKKYGYVPASFEESFKSIYPEANFKTMETPYGAFMYDGKDWKQIQMQQVKTPSRKEMAEEKAVSFGKLQPDSSIDINEFGELVPNSGVYVRGIFSGSPTDATKFRQQMLEGSNAKRAVARLTEINDMVGESMPWNSKLWGEAKALLPQIKAGLRTDIIGVGTVSNYEQELINDVVAEPTKFWSLESSDRAKLAVIMDKISNKLIQEPANFGLEVKVAGKPNAEMERRLKMGNAGKSKLELDFEARGGKKGVGLNWNLSNKIPDALK
jgi:hypothetical protein